MIIVPKGLHRQELTKTDKVQTVDERAHTTDDSPPPLPKIYIIDHLSGQELGLQSESNLQAMIAAGNLRANDWGVREGDAEWQPLSQMFPRALFTPTPSIHVLNGDKSSARKLNVSGKAAWLSFLSVAAFTIIGTAIVPGGGAAGMVFATQFILGVISILFGLFYASCWWVFTRRDFHKRFDGGLIGALCTVVALQVVPVVVIGLIVIFQVLFL